VTRIAPRRGRSRQRERWCRAATALLAACGACTAPAQPDLERVDLEAVAAREIFVEAERTERPLTVMVRIAADVNAPPTAIWDVLKACEVAPEYVPNVVSCKSIETVDDGRGELFVQTVKPIFFLPTFEHVFRLDYTPYTRIDVRRVSGPIAHMEGTWWLLPQDNGHVLLVYELALDPGMPIPRFLVRATLKRDLPKVVAAVRERAEAAR
jgi:hypothetical protein